MGRERYTEKRAACMVANARFRAGKRGIPFNLDAEDVEAFQKIIDAGACQLSGISFTILSGQTSTSPSLDRIDPALGYVKGNVRVICHALNMALGNWGEVEFRRIATAYLTAEPSA